jgi:hypothetical protein
MFDVADHLDELRSWPTDRLEARRHEVVLERRRLATEELAIVRVLDERGRIDPTVGDHGESARTVRDKVETARRLESLPEIAAAAYEGAPNVAPGDLARMARNASKPTTEDSRARFEARSLRMWWTPDKGMLHLRGQLPDVMGATLEATITKLTEQMKPAKGQAWDSFEHRAADALVSLSDPPEAKDEGPTLAPRPVLQLSAPLHGPVEIAGIPIADSLLEQLRVNVSIEPVLVDGDGVAVAIGKRFTVLSPKVVRAVLLRDGGCRYGTCRSRRGLEVHHLRPRSWGGSDDISGLVAVCAKHHRMLVPHGPSALVGNPNQPDGLRLSRIDELSPDQAAQLGLPSRRAGPTAA